MTHGNSPAGQSGDGSTLPSMLQTDDLNADLLRRSVRGGAAVMVGQGTMVVLGIVSVAVLGRLLTPDDFGLLAMAGAFLALITNFADLGLPQATIQRPEVTEDQVNALFWVNLAVGLTAAIVGVGIAYPISWFFGEPALVSIIAALSLAFLVSGFSAQHQALLRRRMRFGAESTIAVSAMAGGIVVAIVAASLGAGYWALVLLTLTTSIFRTIGLWIACDWRPGRPRRAVGLRSMVGFGAYLAGTNVLGTLVRNLDRILIGRLFGSGAAGYYTNAYRLLLMPLAQLNTPLTSVAIPTLSRLQEEPERFRAFYRRGVEAIVAVSFPAILACVIAADHLVPAVLGNQWDDSIPIFKALGPAALLASTGVATSWVFVPLGRTDRQFRWQLFRSCCIIIAYFIGLRWGVVGVAASFSIAACLLRIPGVLYCLHGTFLRLGDIGSSLWRIAVASCFSSAITVPLAYSLGPDAHHVGALALLSVTFAVAYVLGWLIVPGGFSRLMTMRATAQHLLPGRGAPPPESISREPHDASGS